MSYEKIFCMSYYEKIKKKLKEKKSIVIGRHASSVIKRRK
jgi:hypothetical protein